MKWQIKKFDELDIYTLQAIYALRVAVFVVEQNCPYQEVDQVDLRAWHIYATNDAGEIIAYARMMPEWQPEKASFGRVIVRGNQRGQKLGEQLLNRVMQFLDEQAPKKAVYIQAQTYLTDFYRKFGFTEASESYLEDDIPHTDMEKL